jgi:hypothetical protein
VQFVQVGQGLQLFDLEACRLQLLDQLLALVKDGVCLQGDD